MKCSEMTVTVNSNCINKVKLKWKSYLDQSKFFPVGVKLNSTHWVSEGKAPLWHREEKKAPLWFQFVSAVRGPNSSLTLKVTVCWSKVYLAAASENAKRWITRFNPPVTAAHLLMRSADVSALWAVKRFREIFQVVCVKKSQGPNLIFTLQCSDETFDTSAADFQCFISNSCQLIGPRRALSWSIFSQDVSVRCLHSNLTGEIKPVRPAEVKQRDEWGMMGN